MANVCLSPVVFAIKIRLEAGLDQNSFSASLMVAIAFLQLAEVVSRICLEYLSLCVLYRSDGEDGRHNKEAMLLMRDITSTAVGSIPVRDRFINRNFMGENGFGSSPSPWNGPETGSVFIARTDGVPLLKEHVEALCAYIENKIEPQLSKSIVGLEAGAAVPQREAILNSITKADFLDFFNSTKAQKAAANATWANVPTPYELRRNDRATDINALFEEARLAGYRQQSDMPRQRFFMTDP